MTADVTQREDAHLVSDRDLATLPKIELHVHLNGAISEATASVLARRHGADPDSALGLTEGRYPGRYADFGGFLESYMAANAFVRTPDDVELVAAEFARGQAAQNIVYSEAIFTAMIFVRNGMEPNEMWAALRSGLSAGGESTRIGLVVDAIRDLGQAEAEATVRLVENADAPIVGLALTGVDSTASVESFRILREASSRLGMGLEVHAGEMGAPSTIVDALDVLGADRIGHGVAAINDPGLMERLLREQVPLDICPSSNVGTGLFPSLEAHPVAEFWRAGMNITISSDDPPFFATSLTDELRHVVRLCGLSRGDLAELQRRAARSSFASAPAKEEMLDAIDVWARHG